MPHVSLIHFLLVFDVKKQELISHEAFSEGDVAAATTRYAELEREYRGDLDVEIVLVGADSLDTIKQTHGNYFSRTSSDRFADLVSA